MGEGSNISLEYWIGVLTGGLVTGLLFGLIPLGIGFALGETKAAKRAFWASAVIGLIGGLKFLGVLSPLILWPIFEARRQTKLQKDERNQASKESAT